MTDLSISNIGKINKSKNIFFDENSWCLIEISKKYDLKKSKSTKLALIYFENRTHIDKNDNDNEYLISPNGKFKYISTGKLAFFDLTDILTNEYGFTLNDVDLIDNRLNYYTNLEKLIIISNLKDLPEEPSKKKDTFINKVKLFLNMFEILDEYKKIKKYSLNEINNLTLYFLLKNKEIDLYYTYRNSKSIKRIVDCIYI